MWSIIVALLMWLNNHRWLHQTYKHKLLEEEIKWCHCSNMIEKEESLTGGLSTLVEKDKIL